MLRMKFQIGGGLLLDYSHRTNQIIIYGCYDSLRIIDNPRNFIFKEFTSFEEIS